MKGQRSHVNDPKHEREHELDVMDIRNSGVRHEEGDINVGPVYKFLIWLGISVVAIYFIVYGIMKWNDSRMAKMDQVATHLSKSKTEQLPPEPRLQLAPGHAVHPLIEGMQYRDSVMKLLLTYGYINQTAGTVHIPIELAKQLVIQKGLPTRAQQTPATVPAIMEPSASSAGRVLENRDQRIPGGTFTVTGGNLNVQGGAQ